MQHVVARPEEQRQYSWQQYSGEQQPPASLPARLLATLVHAVDAAALAGCRGAQGPEQGSPQQQQEQGRAQQQSRQGPSAEPPSKRHRGGEPDHAAAAAAGKGAAVTGTVAAAVPMPAVGEAGGGMRASAPLLAGVVGWSLDWLRRVREATQLAAIRQHVSMRKAMEDMGVQQG